MDREEVCGRRATPIGLVLSGGGAKGAYQAGVWKAMAEFGLAERVRAISGTSIGAINAAAFAALGSPTKVERFWMENVGDAADARTNLFSQDFFAEAAERLSQGKRFPIPGLLDRSGLERMLHRGLPPVWPAGGPAVYATALECIGGALEFPRREGYRLRRFRVDCERNPERRVRMLLASASMPYAFDTVEIDGVSFVDGGWETRGGDNTPLSPILENHPELRTIIVVRLNTDGDDPHPLRLPRKRGVHVVEIRPSQSPPGPLDVVGALMGNRSELARALRIWSGVFAFHPAYARRSFDLGYADALTVISQGAFR